jgi:hypothetical protein
MPGAERAATVKQLGLEYNAATGIFKAQDQQGRLLRHFALDIHLEHGQSYRVKPSLLCVSKDNMLAVADTSKGVLLCTYITPGSRFKWVCVRSKPNELFPTDMTFAQDRLLTSERSERCVSMRKVADGTIIMKIALPSIPLSLAADDNCTIVVADDSQVLVFDASGIPLGVLLRRTPKQVHSWVKPQGLMFTDTTPQALVVASDCMPDYHI